jgi:hypothetical protein
VFNRHTVLSDVVGTTKLPGSASSVTIKVPDVFDKDKVPNLQPSAQLEALLRIKAAIDKSGVLHDWTRASGLDTGTGENGYCRWHGVRCQITARLSYTSNVDTIDIHTSGKAGIQGLMGSLPPAAAFTGLGGLRDLSIRDQPGLSGTLPGDWPRLTQLRQLVINNTSVSGTIPSTWGSWSSLVNMVLSNLRLHGELPSSFTGLTLLEVLGVANTALSGTLPSSLASLPKLRILTLANNTITGTVPASIGSMNRLEALLVGGNKLTGTLPDAFQALNDLEVLDLSSNLLSGTIPASWAGMKSLQVVVLFGNPRLGGCLPKSWKQQLPAEFDLNHLVFNGTNIRGFC